MCVMRVKAWLLEVDAHHVIWVMQAVLFRRSNGLRTAAPADQACGSGFGVMSSEATLLKDGMVLELH
jgi:hypothetical protein